MSHACLHATPVPQVRVTYYEERNARKATIDWQFTSRQARVKLKKLYPVVTPPLPER